MVQYTQAANEFIDVLRPATLMGRLPGTRGVPSNVTIPRQTASASVD